MSIMIICIVKKFKDWHHLTIDKQTNKQTNKQHISIGDVN